jgi:hypothetical protein
VRYWRCPVTDLAAQGRRARELRITGPLRAPHTTSLSCMVMRNPCAGAALDPPVWKMPNTARALSLSYTREDQAWDCGNVCVTSVWLLTRTRRFAHVVEGLGLRAGGLGFRVQGLGLRPEPLWPRSPSALALAPRCVALVRQRSSSRLPASPPPELHPSPPSALPPRLAHGR